VHEGTDEEEVEAMGATVVRRHAGIFAAALFAVATATVAQARSDDTVYDREPGEQAAPAFEGGERRTLRIDRTYDRDVASGCRYRATVRGTVHMQRATDDTEPRFAPDLLVRAELRCPGRAAAHARGGRVRGSALTAEALARAVGVEGRVATAATGYACTYEPTFDVTEGRVGTMALSQACHYPAPPAIGGGPR
jgi:hypothetical protein